MGADAGGVSTGRLDGCDGVMAGLSGLAATPSSMRVVEVVPSLPRKMRSRFVRLPLVTSTSNAVPG
jgi:hypothetical protein